METVSNAYFLDAGKEYYEILRAGAEEPVPIMKWLLDTAATKSHTLQESWKVCVLVLDMSSCCSE